MLCARVCFELSSLLFFFNDTATTEIYTLSLHDALPICLHPAVAAHAAATAAAMLDGRFFLGLGTGERLSEHVTGQRWPGATEDRKSTRLNSSHANISYAVFCLKKKKKTSASTTLAKKNK